jgi:hypothetical protein
VVVSGINIANGVVNVSNNTIANIANTSTGTTARVRGILIASTLSGINVRNNIIDNLSTTGTGSGTGFNGSIAAGIVLAPSGQYVNDTIAANRISNISIESTNALTVTNVSTGIWLTNLNNGVAASNRIYNIRNKTTGTTAGQSPMAAGITNSFGNTSYVVNNMISLGVTEGTNTQFTGIYQATVGTGNTHNYYFNTVVISGSAGGTISSYAFVRGTDTSTLQNMVTNAVDNIFYMLRLGGGSVNYAIGNRGTAPSPGLTGNYNVLYNPDATAIGYWNNTGYNLAGWQGISGQDANSKSVPVTFVDVANGDLHLSGTSVGDINLAGTPIAGLTTDYDNDARSATKPYMGADEALVALPILLNYFTGVRRNGTHILSWKADCSSPVRFVVERSGDARKFDAIETINATPLDCASPFSITDRTPLEGINYYRLKMEDLGGRFTYSIVIALINKQSGFEIISVQPTLVNENTYVNITSTKATQVTLRITDVNGRTVKQFVQQVANGTSLLPVDVSQLANGIYQITGSTADGYSKTFRFVKQ